MTDRKQAIPWVFLFRPVLDTVGLYGNLALDGWRRIPPHFQNIPGPFDFGTTQFLGWECNFVLGCEDVMRRIKRCYIASKTKMS